MPLSHRLASVRSRGGETIAAASQFLVAELYIAAVSQACQLHSPRGGETIAAASQALLSSLSVYQPKLDLVLPLSHRTASSIVLVVEGLPPCHRLVGTTARAVSLSGVFSHIVLELPSCHRLISL